MRILTLCMAIFFTVSLKVQTVNFNIEGSIEKPQKAKFAYLVSTAQKDGKSDLFLVQPINNNHFKFTGKSDLNGDLTRFAFVFFDESGRITLSEVKAKIKDKVWYVGGSANLKGLYLESLSLNFDNPNNLAASKILSGGKLLKQDEGSLLALKERKLLEFVKANPDSPFALSLVNRTLSMFNYKADKGSASFYKSPNELYSALSPRLKQTKEGLLLKNKIDQAKMK